MKVVLYSSYFFPTSGGVQSNVFELAHALSEWRGNTSDERIEVTVITRTAEMTAQDSSWPFRLMRRPGFARFVRVLREADVVHIAGPAMLPMVIGLALRKPIVIVHHGYQAACPNGLLLLDADRAVCPGHFIAGHYRHCLKCNSREMGRLGSLRSLLLQFPRRCLCKVVSLNVVITEHVGTRIALPRKQTILYGIRDLGRRPFEQNDVIEIGYVGRLVQEKGLSLLLKAAKRLQDNGFAFQLTFVGDGPLRNELEQESMKLGLAACTRFTGDLQGPDLERAVRPLRIVVMPSIWEETAGLAAIEQMMRGGIIVASDIGGLGEVVGDAGLKFIPGDSNALYARLRELLERPSVLPLLSIAGRERAMTNFNLEKMTNAYVAAYQSVLRVQKTRPQSAL